MSNDHSSLVSKVWNYAHVLRDQGVPYGDYLEQITYLLFLKMDEERSDLLGEPSLIPKEYRWETMTGKDGDALEVHYRHTLDALAKEAGLLGTIFRKSQNKIQDPAKLKRIVSMIDGETWIGLDVDVKGAIYEGLLERNAQEVKSGAGQYFTPRPVIQAMVEVMDPRPGDTVLPARGLRPHSGEDQGPAEAREAENGNVFRDRYCRPGSAAVRHEPLPSRHWGAGMPHC